MLLFLLFIYLLDFLTIKIKNNRLTTRILNIYLLKYVLSLTLQKKIIVKVNK